MLTFDWSKPNIGCFLAFFGRKLLLVVFQQPFKIEARVIRQIVCIFNVYHILRKIEILASHWPKPNIGFILATVKHRKMCITPNHSYSKKKKFVPSAEIV